jgi:hypothetical protein
VVNVARKFEISRRRLECNFKMDLKETRCKRVNFIHMPEDGIHWWVVVKTVINFFGFHKRRGVS